MRILLGKRRLSPRGRVCSGILEILWGLCTQYQCLFEKLELLRHTRNVDTPIRAANAMGLREAAIITRVIIQRAG